MGAGPGGCDNRLVRRGDITAGLVSRLVGTQFPRWAGLPVQPVRAGGVDNVTFRLGEELAARLPSGLEYVPGVVKEQRWLPILAGQLPLPIPELVGHRLDVPVRRKQPRLHRTATRRPGNLDPGTRLGDLESNEGSRRRA